MSAVLDVRPRFRRSVRIDSDFATASAIDGFHCPASFRHALAFMAQHIRDTGQSAFTWTGPYGGGKSSLALALACLTGAKKAVRDQAADLFGDETFAALKAALPYFPLRWGALPLVAEKRSMTEQLAEALEISTAQENLSKAILEALKARSEDRGLLLIMDELGRGLEAAARGEGDVHLLQDIAELAARSNGRFVFIGILHQSFEEYAEILGREARDSWAKIQGRFVDIAISVSLEETVELISQAIGQDTEKEASHILSAQVVSQIRPMRSETQAAEFAARLAACKPLHPLTACLLGPLSQRRFGQNQRSVFSFLYSSEPFGLQDRSQQGETGNLYPVDKLWDYVRANLEAAVLSSPDSRRWAVAADAIERCVARGGSPLELRILKSIGILELLKDRSGFSATPETLTVALHRAPNEALEKALKSLVRHSEIVYRKHSGAYVLFAGSDFDVDAKVEEVLSEVVDFDLGIVRELADLQPLLAKRHHRETGAMRWFDLSIEAVSGLEAAVRHSEKLDTIGRIIIALPTGQETETAVREAITDAMSKDCSFPILIGFARRGQQLVDYVQELSALMSLGARYPELRGDTVARREIDARSADLRRRIEDEVQYLLEESDWYQKGQSQRKLSKRALSELLSSIADQCFPESPRIQNELLNCSSPSSNAVSARTKLMKRMVLRTHDVDLGFGGKNYPAERGLYVSLLKNTGVHVAGKAGMVFEQPDKDANTLVSLWEAADELMLSADHAMITAQDIIDLWASPPIGLKQGLAHVYIVAYALSRKDTIAIYGEGVFQSKLNELCIEFLVRNPADIGLRRVEMEGLTRSILQELGSLLKLKDGVEPLSVAREIVGQYDALVPWTGRTQSMSPSTLRVREILKRASDPNKLLFDDLPALTAPDAEGAFDAKQVAKLVRDALAEMRAAYPNTLSELKALMLNELNVRVETSDALAALRDRADNIRQVGGDLKMDAFIGRLAQFHGTQEDMEGIASIAANKLPRDWNDGDREKANIGIVELSAQFLKLETMARVKGRKDKRHALAVVMGKGDASLPLFSEFQVSDEDRKDITALATAVDEALSNADQRRREIILAALVEVTSRFMNDEISERQRTTA